MFLDLPEARKLPAALLPSRNIFLLSHMRAYTSLLGHIVGSNPAVCGYYEMHIGYYSWKSLIRQKLLYFRNEDLKPGFSYMFDKVLHNDHHVSPDILNSPRSKVIFSLRRPEQTIPSILKLYSEIDPSHEFNSESFATEYYIQRLMMLEKSLDAMKTEFFYLDAEVIHHDIAGCLASLSEWLQLEAPLSPDYSMQKNTSKVRYGDTSSRLRSGHVTGDTTGYSSFEANEVLMQRAVHRYDTVRRRMIEKSALQSVTEQSNP